MRYVALLLIGCLSGLWLYHDFLDESHAVSQELAGPTGAYCAGLDEDTLGRIREECRRLLGDPAGPFRLPARAWAVRGRVPRS